MNRDPSYPIMFISAAVILILALSACKKDDINPIVGQYYHIKGDIFNKGAYQPAQPVKDIKNYIDGAYHLPFSEVVDQNNVHWFIPQADLQ